MHVSMNKIPLGRDFVNNSPFLLESIKAGHHLVLRQRSEVVQVNAPGS